jgi:hypothetical protein
MFKHDVVQIVDLYPRPTGSHEVSPKVDPDEEAKSLSMLVLPLGRDARKIAIVSKNDERRLLAFQRAGYETHSMNGNRPAELRQLMRQLAADIQRIEPKNTVLVSEDPQFVHFCDAVGPHTTLHVWANSLSAPHELMETNYNFRPLEELLPNLKVSNVDVRIDLENIAIGLVKRGWRANMRELAEGIREALADLGNITTITAYADWDELNKHNGSPKTNWQRDLARDHIESRYVVNEHGKNTADMKIVDDIRNMLEHEPSTPAAIDIVVLATMDRDFRSVIETVQRRGKRVVLLGLEGGFSKQLLTVGAEPRYLDQYLKLPQTTSSKPQDSTVSEASEKDVTSIMRIAAWMRTNSWRFVYRDRLEQQFAGTEDLDKLIEDGWLAPTANSPLGPQGKARMLQVNLVHTTANAAAYLARWIPDRIDYCLHDRGMPHVDTNYLAQGMARDHILTKLGVAQTRNSAENWLSAAEAAAIVVRGEKEHPLSPTKRITTWHLPEPARECDVDEEPRTQTAVPTPSVTTVSSAQLRQMLTEGLSDSELTRLTYDHFRTVHQEVDGAPKFTRIQALLDYVDRTGQYEQLLNALHEVNAALNLNQDLPLAA